jgi:Domain of unknown function (DUF4398)
MQTLQNTDVTKPIVQSAVPMKCFLWFALPLLATLVGCQTTPVPTTDLSDAAGRIEQAFAAGADTHAPVELQFARDKLARAETLVVEKNFAAAMRLANEARADADLALVRARAARLRAEVAEQTLANEALRKELLVGGEQ